MSDKFDEAIQEIAVKHGVVLSKDDPILILQTMNKRLIEETLWAQGALLAQFREEMESISTQWKNDAKEKAEKIINSALAGSKETMIRLFQESSQESVYAMKKMISNSLTEAQDLAYQARKLNRFSLLSSAILIGVGFVLVFFFLILN